MILGALRSKFPHLIICATLAAALSGCVEQLGDVRSQIGTAESAALVRVAAGSTRGTNVGLSSIEGAPDMVTSRFISLFSLAANSQEISLTAPAKANYLVRGYLSAYKVEGGTAIGYVWDIFDARKQRTQRVTDAIVIKSNNPDVWLVADDAVLASLADKSVNDLAQFLAATPEAQAIAAAATPLPVARPAGPLAFAPLQ